MSPSYCLFSRRLYLSFYCFIIFFFVSMSTVSSNELVSEQMVPRHVPEATSSIKADGQLDEQAWQDALVLDLPYEVTPAENVPAPVKTECLLTYDKDNLYIGYRAYDPEPWKIRAYYKDRDTILQDDCVGVTIDTFNDERRAYDFFSTPFGIQFDAIDAYNGTDTSWDAIWESAGKIYDWGYAVEMVIPFSQLRIQRKNGAPQIWGIDCDRRYPREYSRVLGLFPRDRNNNCYLCQLEKIEGFSGVEHGYHLEVSPTLTWLRTERRPDFPEGELEKDDDDVEAGITARWGMTPNLTLLGTINPDFSQVEADNLQLDVNEPFALYYQEKRPFFNEGRDYFQTPMDAVYTRSIYDPSWGLKVAGKEGDNTIGFYLVQDDYTALLFPGSQVSGSTSMEEESTSGVFRYRRDITTDYSLGLIYTDRTGEDYYNRVIGLDGDFRLSQNDRIVFQYLHSFTEYPEEIIEVYDQPEGNFEGGGIDLRYEHNTRELSWWLNGKSLSDNFRTDLGFIPMVNYWMGEAGMEYRWYPSRGTWWSSLNGGSEVQYIEEQDGQSLMQSAKAWLYGFGTSQSWARVDAELKNEHYNNEDFDLFFYSLQGNFKPMGNLWLSMQFRGGDRIDYANTRLGERIQLRPQMQIYLGKHFNVALTHVYEKMCVQSDRLYTANITEGTVIFQLNRQLFLRTILQYVDYDFNPENYTFAKDSEYQNLFSQVLLSYKMNPRTVLFLGYSDNQTGTEEFDLTRENRTFFAKIGYAFLW